MAQHPRCRRHRKSTQEPGTVPDVAAYLGHPKRQAAGRLAADAPSKGAPGRRRDLQLRTPIAWHDREAGWVIPEERYPSPRHPRRWRLDPKAGGRRCPRRVRWLPALFARPVRQAWRGRIPGGGHSHPTWGDRRHGAASIHALRLSEGVTKPDLLIPTLSCGDDGFLRLPQVDARRHVGTVDLAREWHGSAERIEQR